RVGVADLDDRRMRQALAAGDVDGEERPERHDDCDEDRDRDDLGCSLGHAGAASITRAGTGPVTVVPLPLALSITSSPASAAILSCMICIPSPASVVE